MKYRAVMVTSATCTVTFEAPEGATEKELREAADKTDKPTLCHHCASKDDLTIGDDWDVDMFGSQLQIFPEEN
jgi:hypothetical protein